MTSYSYNASAIYEDFPVVKDDCFIFNGDTPIESTWGKKYEVKGNTFKCTEIYNHPNIIKAVYAIRYSKSDKKFGESLYVFPESEFENINPIHCPSEFLTQEVLGGKRKNRKNSKLTKKFRRNRRRYSRRN